jgi:hypothetical protein
VGICVEQPTSGPFRCVAHFAVGHSIARSSAKQGHGYVLGSICCVVLLQISLGRDAGKVEGFTEYSVHRK